MNGVKDNTHTWEGDEKDASTKTKKYLPEQYVSFTLNIHVKSFLFFQVFKNFKVEISLLSIMSTI